MVCWALGCTSPAAPKSSDPPPTDTGGASTETPYLGPDTSTGPPDVDLEGLTRVLNETLVAAPSAHSGPAVAAWNAMLSHADTDCPRWTYSSGTEVWADTCTTSDGTSFDGYGYQVVYNDYFDGYNTWTGLGLSTASAIALADGTRFDGVGSAVFLQGTTVDGNAIWYAALDAAFTYDGPSADIPIDDASLPSTTWTAVQTPDGSGGAVTLDGVFVTDPADGFEALVFDGLLLYTESWGSSCPEEPAGVISARDTQGNWLDILFDGPVWDSAPTAPEDCDGCGVVWSRGYLLGTVCADFHGLLQLSDYPISP